MTTATTIRTSLHVGLPTAEDMGECAAIVATHCPDGATVIPSTWAEVCTEGYVHAYLGPVPPSDDAMLDLAFALDRAFDLD